MVFLLSLCLLFAMVDALHDSMNFLLAAGTRECFYEQFESDTSSRTIEAFVQSGGNLDVILQVFGPLSIDHIRKEEFPEIALLEEKVDAKKEAESETQTVARDFTPPMEGVYAICLDNRHASFIPKIVQLDVRRATRKATPNMLSQLNITNVLKETSGSLGNDTKMLPPSTAEMESLQRSLEAIPRIRKGIMQIQRQQLHDRRRLQLHSETNSLNRSRAAVASWTETGIYILAALFQIFFVRKWFMHNGGAAPQGGKKLTT